MPRKTEIKENIEDVGNTVKKVSKETTKKASTASKKTVANVKKAAARTRKAVEEAAEAAVVKPDVYVQFYGRQVEVAQVVEKAKEDFKSGSKEPIRSLKLYIKPEDNMAYYVINDSECGRVDL